MNRYWLAGLAFCVSGAVRAQDSGVNVSVGVRAWYTGWTTFSYLTDGDGHNTALTQVSADDKLVLIPTVSASYGDFVGSVSGFPSTRFSFSDGSSGYRKEFDANIGYAVVRGLNLTVGYKKVSQRSGITRYEPAGPVFGLSAYAPLRDALSFYGNLAVGRLKTPSSNDANVVQFATDYRLTELGLAYTLNPGRWAQRWAVTAGYRIQVMHSKEALGTQDGIDTTQGFTLGTLLTF